MKILNALIALFLTGILCIAVLVAYGVWLIKAPGPLAEQKIVFIEPGSSISKISRQLESEDILAPKTAKIFPYVARFQDGGLSLKAGEYLIKPEMSAGDVLALLQAGKTIQRQVTIPEGMTSVEIIDIINAADVMEGEITEIPSEGSLLPESYSYIRNDQRSKIVKRMQDHMQQALDALWENRAEDLPYETKEEAVILASIVEKETGVPSERSRVAGVFVNRLRLGMPLQSDPTVIYAITKGKEKLTRKLYFKDLKREDDYNTYFIAGLPPGPIANPGRASLKAALNPEDHDYLYFVADGTGGHVFAKTLKEHNRNVAKWRKINRAK
jgi:UPF0755 protein